MLTDEKESINQFNILIENYEGPIDLLLDLAKRQKVDLSEISILSLAEQYLIYINNYKKMHLEIAADYLVMASWLTYLKSRLLLPKIEQEENHTTEELEEAIRFQLKRLESMQKVSKILYDKPQIGRDIFYGGSRDGVKIKYKITYTAKLFDLIKSYGNILRKNIEVGNLTIVSSELLSVNNAINRIKGMFGMIEEWINFYKIVPELGKNRTINKSFISSNFVATLELTKNGFLDLKQNETFSNIYIKAKNNKKNNKYE